MKKVICLTLIVIMCFIFNACDYEEDKSNNHIQIQTIFSEVKEWDARQERIQEQLGNRFETFIIDNNYLIIDHNTNVQYFGHDGGHDGGLTVLVDETGTPLLYKGEYD